MYSGISSHFSTLETYKIMKNYHIVSALYGIYALGIFVAEISVVRYDHSFDF